MMQLKKYCLYFMLICTSFLFTACTTEQVQSEEIKLVSVFDPGHFNIPVAVVHAGDGSERLFVLEKKGLIQELTKSGDRFTARKFLDISDRVFAENSEQGLLGLAFHPNFRNNGYFYVNYTTETETVISSFQATSNPDEPNSTYRNDVYANTERKLLSFKQPYSNHNGGDLAFGPDGLLYIASGDGGSGGDPQGNGQNLQSLLGKILRIEVTPDDANAAFRIPVDNPFVDGKDGARPEIYAYGLRNPWRISFDSQTGELWTADVGQNEREEIDVIVNGGNYGWNVMEGTACFAKKVDCDPKKYIAPVFEYEHGFAGASVTGGYVYRGERIPALQGKYVFSDFLDGRMWTLLKRADGTMESNQLDLKKKQITSFGVDESDELFALTYEGEMLRFELGDGQ